MSWDWHFYSGTTVLLDGDQQPVGDPVIVPVIAASREAAYTTIRVIAWLVERRMLEDE
jgi:hypothetical protein